jgi:hypothetical protein
MDAWNGEPFDEWWVCLPADLRARLLADPALALTDEDYLEVSRHDLHVVYRAEGPHLAASTGWRLRTPVQAFIVAHGTRVVPPRHDPRFSPPESTRSSAPA